MTAVVQRLLGQLEAESLKGPAAETGALIAEVVILRSAGISASMEGSDG